MITSIQLASALDGKVVVITGASSGLGAAIASCCAESGARLILTGRNIDALHTVQSSLKNSTDHVVITADLSSSDDIARLNERVKATGLKVNGFVHSAGISTTLPLKLSSASKLNAYYTVNLVSGVTLATALSNKQVVAPGGASFIFISSVMGVVGEVGKTIYSATKGAVIAAVRSMALELAAKNIRVNAISPGVVPTRMVESATYSQDLESRTKVELLHPLGTGKPEDVAYAAAFLLSDAARWITGTNLIVDGGYTAK